MQRAPTSNALLIYVQARYNLWHSAKKLWEAHLWIASVLIVLWSGIWPYTKLAIGAFLRMGPSTNKDGSSAFPRLCAVASTLGKWYVRTISPLRSALRSAHPSRSASLSSDGRSLLDVWIAALVTVQTCPRTCV